MKQLNRFYARKTSHGISKVAHTMRSEDWGVVDGDDRYEYLLCNPNGAYKPGTLRKMPPEHFAKECERCVEEAARMVTDRIRGGKDRAIAYESI